MRLSVSMPRQYPLAPRSASEGRPPILLCVSPILLVFGARALASGDCVRIDVAKARAGVEPWPRWCWEANQFEASMEAIVRAAAGRPSEGSLYPVTLWFLPAGSNGEELIEMFRQAPFDADLLQGVFRERVMRCDVSSKFVDLSVGPDRAQAAIEWVRLGVGELYRGRVEWYFEPIDETDAEHEW